MPKENPGVWDKAPSIKKRCKYLLLCEPKIITMGKSDQQIVREINKFLTMTPSTDNKILTEQFACIKGKIDTELGYQTPKQQEVNIEAFNLMDTYSNEDIRFFFPDENSSEPVNNKATVLYRLQGRASQVKKLIQENF